MQTLNIDTGVQEFSVNGRGVLRFNPGDPNLYHRFFALGDDLAALDGELEQQLASLPGAEGDAEHTAAALALLADYDRRIKGLLNGIFGAENDFNALLEGVNLAGVGTNGKRVVQNLLEALAPLLEAGARRQAEALADTAVAEADAARAARCGA